MSAQSLIEEVKKRSAWSISMGVLTAALGVFLIIYPLVTATITTVLFGWVLILVGVAQFVFALHSQKVGKFFLKVLVGVLFGIVGFFLAFAPVAGLEALTALLGTMLLVQAGLAKTDRRLGMVLVRCCGKLRIRHIDPRQMASSSVWAIRTLVGASLLLGGISRIMIAAKIRSGASSVERALHAA
jgi:uncharacterized membrane protein HdeD (DUF308 family)